MYLVKLTLLVLFTCTMFGLAVMFLHKALTEHKQQTEMTPTQTTTNP